MIGILPAEYVAPDDDDWNAAFGVACDQIHHALIESARDRGRICPPLAVEVIGHCVPHLNRVMEHMTAAAMSRAADAADQSIEALPGDAGFRVTFNARTQLTITFCGIEECDVRDGGGAVVLPANEFFDDACIVDRRSALGAFVTHHFPDEIDAFKQIVAAERRSLRPILVERETGQLQESYGVGTSIYLPLPLDSDLQIILTAATRKRAGEGIKAEPE